MVIKGLIFQDTIVGNLITYHSVNPVGLVNVDEILGDSHPTGRKCKNICNSIF